MPSDEDEPLIRGGEEKRTEGSGEENTQNGESKKTDTEAETKEENESGQMKIDKADQEEEKAENTKKAARGKKASEKGSSDKKAATDKNPTKEAAEKSAPEKGDKRKERETAKEKAEQEESDDEEEADDDEEAKKGGSYWNVDPGKKRERKSLEAFHPETPKTEIVIEQGSGKKLKDIPGVVARIQEHVINKKNKDDPLKILSRMLFNRIPGPKELRENLLEFSGKVFKDKKEEENFRQIRVGKRTMAELKGILEVLGLERSGKQSELADRLFAFLKKPSKEGVKGKSKSKAPTPKASQSGKKRKSSSKKASKDEDEDEEEDEEDEDQEEEEEEEEAPPAKRAKVEKGKREEEKSEKSSEKKKEEQKVEKKSKKSEEDTGEKKAEKKGEKKKRDKEASASEEASAPADEDGGDGDDEELRKNITTICSNADLSTLTLRMVREQLAKDYEVDVAEKKDVIRKYVDQYVASQEAKKST